MYAVSHLTNLTLYFTNRTSMLIHLGFGINFKIIYPQRVVFFSYQPCLACADDLQFITFIENTMYHNFIKDLVVMYILINR